MSPPHLFVSFFYIPGQKAGKNLNFWSFQGLWERSFYLSARVTSVPSQRSPVSETAIILEERAVPVVHSSNVNIQDVTETPKRIGVIQYTRQGAVHVEPPPAYKALPNAPKGDYSSTYIQCNELEMFTFMFTWFTLTCAVNSCWQIYVHALSPCDWFIKMMQTVCMGKYHVSSWSVFYAFHSCFQWAYLLTVPPFGGDSRHISNIQQFPLNIQCCINHVSYSQSFRPRHPYNLY